MATDWIAGKSGYFDLGSAYESSLTNWAALRFEWVEEYSPSVNKHRITITPKGKCAWSAVTNTNVGKFLTGTVTINGSTVFNENNYNVGIVFYSVGSYYTFTDAADGYATERWISPEFSGNTASVVLNLYMNTQASGYSRQSYSSTQTLTLTNIIEPASTFSLSTTSVNVGDSITATIIANNSSFTHKIKFYINNTYFSEYTVASGLTTYTFIIPTSWYGAMSSASSCTAYCQLTTYNGSSQVGDVSTKSFTVKVPDSVKPSISSFTLTASSGKAYLIQGLDTLSLTAKATAGQGSSIRSYTFSGPHFSQTAYTSSTETTLSGVKILVTGELTYTVTVTDTRGRTNSVTSTITCYAYFVPIFQSFSAYRSNSSGVADAKGIYIQCAYTINWASDVPNNSISVACKGPSGTVQSSTSNTILFKLSDTNATDTTYQMWLEAKDAYGSVVESSKIVIFGGDTRILNIRPDGTGMAVGKMAKENSDGANLLDIRWDVNIDGNLTASNIIQPVNLWDGNSNGTISFTDSTSSDVTTYSYFEIYYTDNNGKGCGYTKVHHPIGQEMHLSLIEPSKNTATALAGRTYVRKTAYTITGSGQNVTITPDPIGCGYLQIRGSGESSEIITYSTGVNYICITKVVGYK